MKKGFTLSEVLITLSVVGIVAVLTIPGVMHNYQNRLYTSQLEKVYSQIANATQTMMTTEHVDNFYETSGSRETIFAESDTEHQQPKSGVGLFLVNYFKNVRRNCSSDGTCASTSDSFYTNIAGEALTGVTEDTYCILTVGGATICGIHDVDSACTSIVVDVNGAGRPNVAGRDVFSMDIHRDGSLSDHDTVVANACRTNGNAADTCGSLGGSVLGAPAGCLNNVVEAGWAMEY